VGSFKQKLLMEKNNSTKDKANKAANDLRSKMMGGGAKTTKHQGPISFTSPNQSQQP
jgi:hypothetical protein